MPRQETPTPDERSVTIANLRKAVEYLERFRGGQERERIAGDLEMTVSGLRKLLAPIEGRLDVALAERDKESPGRLVPSAEEFLAAARKLVQDYDALFCPRAFGVRQVRVGAYPTIAALFLARRVLPALLLPDRVRTWAGSPDPFPARFPFHQLEWTVATRAEIVRGVERGTLDFGIVDRDANQAGEPTPGGFAWTVLFESGAYGFLYHQHNKEFDGVAKRANRFGIDYLRGQTLILSRFDSRAVKDSLLPDPFIRKATRCYVGSYREVYEAVRVNAGVGVGFEPKGA